MKSTYILPILAILFQIGATTDVDSDLKIFVELCFLPKSPVPFNEVKETLQDDDRTINVNPYHIVIGNKVMEEKLLQLLTDKMDKVPEEDLDKMCAKANIESFDDTGVSYGKFWGFENNTATYTCEGSKDFPGTLRCNLASASKKIDEDTLSFLHITNENALMEIDCFKSGHVGWALYSQDPSKITEKEKKYYFARANALGFPENTNVVLYGEKCAVQI